MKNALFFKCLGVTILLSLTVFLNMVAGKRLIIAFSKSDSIQWEMVPFIFFILSHILLTAALTARFSDKSNNRNYACNFRCKFFFGWFPNSKIYFKALYQWASITVSIWLLMLPLRTTAVVDSIEKRVFTHFFGFCLIQLKSLFIHKSAHKSTPNISGDPACHREMAKIKYLCIIIYETFFLLLL